MEIPNYFVKDGEELKLYPTQKKLGLMLLIAVFSFAVCSWIVWKEGLEKDPGLYVLLFGALLGAIVTILTLKELFAPSPLIVLTPTEIATYQRPFFTRKSIAWNDIKTLALVGRRTKTRNVDYTHTYIEIIGPTTKRERDTPLSRFIFHEKAEKTETINITLQMLPCKKEDLFNFIGEYYGERIGF